MRKNTSPKSDRPKKWLEKDRLKNEKGVGTVGVQDIPSRVKTLTSAVLGQVGKIIEGRI